MLYVVCCLTSYVPLCLHVLYSSDVLNWSGSVCLERRVVRRGTNSVLSSTLSSRPVKYVLDPGPTYWSTPLNQVEVCSGTCTCKDYDWQPLLYLLGYLLYRWPYEHGHERMWHRATSSDLTLPPPTDIVLENTLSPDKVPNAHPSRPPQLPPNSHRPPPCTEDQK